MFKYIHDVYPRALSLTCSRFNTPSHEAHDYTYGASHVTQHNHGNAIRQTPEHLTGVPIQDVCMWSFKQIRHVRVCVCIIKCVFTGLIQCAETALVHKSATVAFLHTQTQKD